MGSMDRVNDQPSDADLADLLRVTERRRLRAIVEADTAAADQIHADDYQ